MAEHLPPQEGRLRRIAQVRPVGIKAPVIVTQLLLTEGEDGVISDEHIERHEAALDAITEGNWTQANELLTQMPAEDAPSRFLVDFLTEHDLDPPSDWDGAINLKSK